MVDERTPRLSARRLPAVLVDTPMSDEERQIRYLLATHSPDAPEDVHLHPNEVEADHGAEHRFAVVDPLSAAGPWEGLDYSSARPSVASLQACNTTAVLRYNDYSELGTGGVWKAIYNGERQTLHNAGIGWKPNSEITGEEPFGGAAEARRLAPVFIRSLEAMGAPKGVGIGDFYSTDREITTTTQMDTVIEFYDEYNRRFVDAGYWGSGYGQFWLALRLAKDLGLASWLTYAWSYRLIWDAAACRREGVSTDLAAPVYQWNNSQVCGGVAELDLNHIYNPYTLGAWWPPGSPFIQGGTLSDAQVQQIMDYLDSKLNGPLGEQHIVKQVVVDQLNGGLATQIWSYKPTGTSHPGDFMKIIVDGILGRVDSINGKVDALASLVKAQGQALASVVQDTDALQALEQAQADALARLQAGDANLLAAIQALETGTISDEQARIIGQLVSQAAAPEIVHAMVEEMQITLTHRADVPTGDQPSPSAPTA